MILDQLEQHARAQPHATFLREGDATRTFGELFDQVTRLAAWLRSGGVGYGDRVVLYLDGRIHHLSAYLAVMTLGAIPVHIYAQRKLAFVAFAAVHTGARLVITDQTFHDQLSCPALSYPDPAEIDLPAVWPGERHKIAHMMFTSGTTGAPKAVMATQENIRFVTDTLIRMLGLTRADREIIVQPLGSGGGLGHFHAHLALGNPLILMSCFFGTMDDNDLHRLLDIIDTENVTGFLATPGLLARLSGGHHREAFRNRGRNLRYLLANTIPMRDTLVNDLMTLLPSTRLYTYYGLAEASRCVHLCYNDTPDKIAAAGRVNPGVEIRIDARDSNQPGEILIKGPNVVDGYWKSDNHGFDWEGWFHSGDIGRMDADGYLYVHGRIQENIRVDGLDCLPQEVEEVLIKLPALSDCAVVGLPDSNTHQRVAAAIVPVAGTDLHGLAQRLRAHCAERIEFYKVPSSFYLVQSIPKSDLGKIDRNKLIQLLETSPRLEQFSNTDLCDLNKPFADAHKTSPRTAGDY